MSGVRRVLYRGDTNEHEYRAAQAEVAAIRSELSRLRRRLTAVGKLEGLPHDSTALAAEGALTMVIMGLYSLVAGEHSFNTRADHTRDRWADAAAHPERYKIEEGKSR